MSGLSSVERELVALGAALGSNCVPCVEHHVAAARTAGLDDRKLGEAIRLADAVRRAPARTVFDTALRLASQPVHPSHVGPAPSDPDQPCCR